MAKTLNLGWCQEYMGLKYHMEDALAENKLNVKYASANPPYCKIFETIESWHHTYRSEEEVTIPYHYILKDHFSEDFHYESYVLDNTLLFEQFHLIHLWPGRRNWKLATLLME